MKFSSPAVELPFLSLSSLDKPKETYAWASAILFTALVVYNFILKDKYNAIPAMCGTDLLSSYTAASKFVYNGKELLHTGYKKYRSKAFRISQPSRWHIIVTGDKLVDELPKAPDDTLSITEALAEMFQAKYTMGPTILTNRYHVDIVRNQLTRNLGTLFSGLREEIILSIEDNIPLTGDWTSVKAFDAVLQIVSRTSNRTFVGAPLCRNPEFLSLNIDHALAVGNGAKILILLPDFLKPLAARYLTTVPKSLQKAAKHLRPIIEERQKKIDEYGLDYPDKPVDFLSWLMDEAKGEERSVLNLTNRIVQVNFAAIHTSSGSFTHALYQLASHPEYIAPLRNEIETIVAQEGWSKASLARMRKLDSFFRESVRMNGLGAITITRTAVKDFTFSDGTFIPKGAMVSAAASARHRDEKIYKSGDTFDGFRFSEIREQEGKSTTNHLVAANPDWIAFGHGRHACPGRFFAANEMKLIMAQLILTYDIKMENEGIRPENNWSGLACLPDTNAEVLFRRRQKERV